MFINVQYDIGEVQFFSRKKKHTFRKGCTKAKDHILSIKAYTSLRYQTIHIPHDLYRSLFLYLYHISLSSPKQFNFSSLASLCPASLHDIFDFSDISFQTVLCHEFIPRQSCPHQEVSIFISKQCLDLFLHALFFLLF